MRDRKKQAYRKLLTRHIYTYIYKLLTYECVDYIYIFNLQKIKMMWNQKISNGTIFLLK